MSIINFTVNFDLFASQTDSSDSGIDADIVPLIGTVKFTPLTTDNRPVLAPTYTPRPAGFKLLPFTGYVDVDGRLKSERSGAIGVRLWANDPVLKLTSLNYKVEFDLRTPLGERVKVDPGYFTAPSTDVVVQLAQVLQATGTVSISTLLPQGPRGFSLAGLTSVGGNYVKALMESALGPIPVGDAVALPAGPAGPAGPIGVALNYKGLWSASANTPTLVDGVGTAGDTWLIATSGTRSLGSGSQTFSARDYVVYNGSVWQRVDATLVAAAGQIIYHGSDATYARPGTAIVVAWVGSVLPTNAIDGDVWMDTSGSAPSISTTTLNSLNVSAVFSQTLVATGTTPVSWSLISGSLPPGILFSDAGNLYGTPTGTGAYNFTVQAVNGYGIDTKVYTGSVGAAVAPTILTTTMGSLVSGMAFSITLSTSGSATITYAVQSGTLPAGLSLNTSTGTISGTPSATGSYTFTIRATNGVGYNDGTFTGTITGVAPTITTTSLNSVWRSFSFSQTLTSSGTATITYAVQSGSLPTGLSLNTSTGAITGTPSATGSYTFTIRATNSYGYNDKAFTGSVLESTPAIVETSLNTISLNVAFSQTLTLSAGGPTITWAVQAGTLPTGLSLNTSTGAITGTPTAAGSYSVTIRATNGTAFNDKAFTGSVVAPLARTAVGTGGTGTASTSWSDSIPTSTTYAIVYFATAIGSGSLNTGNVGSATIGGTAMTARDVVNYGVSGSASWYLCSFVLASPPTGTQTVSLSLNGACVRLRAYALYFQGAASLGTSLTVTSGTGGSMTQTVSSSSSTKLYAQAFANMDNATGTTMTSYSQTLGASSVGNNAVDQLLVGDAFGNGGNLVFSATRSGTGFNWGSLVIPVVP